MAARAAGISHMTPYSSAWKNDLAFQAALKRADEAAADQLEAAAYRRAVHGVEKPIGWHKGEFGAVVTEYSDILTIFLLKGLRPDRYRDRVEVGGGLAHLDLRQLPDELLQRIAQGENIMTVLASALPQRDDGSVDTSRLLAAVKRGTPPSSSVAVEHEDVTGEADGSGEERGE